MILEIIKKENKSDKIVEVIGKDVFELVKEEASYSVRFKDRVLTAETIMRIQETLDFISFLTKYYNYDKEKGIFVILASNLRKYELDKGAVQLDESVNNLVKYIMNLVTWIKIDIEDKSLNKVEESSSVFFFFVSCIFMQKEKKNYKQVDLKVLINELKNQIDDIERELKNLNKQKEEEEKQEMLLKKVMVKDKIKQLISLSLYLLKISFFIRKEEKLKIEAGIINEMEEETLLKRKKKIDDIKGDSNSNSNSNSNFNYAEKKDKKADVPDGSSTDEKINEAEKKHKEIVDFLKQPIKDMELEFYKPIVKIIDRIIKIKEGKTVGESFRPEDLKLMKNSFIEAADENGIVDGAYKGNSGIYYTVLNVPANLLYKAFCTAMKRHAGYGYDINVYFSIYLDFLEKTIKFERTTENNILITIN